MKYGDDFSVIVIVGNWNRSIFNHEWVNKYLLPDAQKVQFEIPLNFNGSERVSTDTMRVSVIENRLNLNAIKANTTVFSKLQDIVYKLCDFLPHTPVESFGFNFIYIAEKSEVNISCFDLPDLGIIKKIASEINEIEYTYKIIHLGRNLTLKVTEKGDKIEFNINVHYKLESLPKFKEIASDNSIEQIENDVLQMLRSVYTVELN